MSRRSLTVKISSLAAASLAALAIGGGPALASSAVPQYSGYANGAYFHVSHHPDSSDYDYADSHWAIRHWDRFTNGSYYFAATVRPGNWSMDLQCFVNYAGDGFDLMYTV